MGTFSAKREGLGAHARFQQDITKSCRGGSRSLRSIDSGMPSDALADSLCLMV